MTTRETVQRCYRLPKIGDGSILDPFRPKYIVRGPRDPESVVLVSASAAKAHEPSSDPAFAIVRVTTTMDEHARLAAQPDVEVLA